MDKETTTKKKKKKEKLRRRKRGERRGVIKSSQEEKELNIFNSDLIGILEKYNGDGGKTIFKEIRSQHFMN